jgi:CIC family chloride channel protein
MIAAFRRWPPDVRYGIALVMVGLLAGAFATAFRLALSAVFRTFFREPDVVEAVRSVPAVARVALPVAGGLVAGLLGAVVARRPGGHGVGDVMEAVTIGRVRVSPSATLLKALASFVAIASGGSLGREGPLILFGGASGGGVAGVLGIDEKRTRALIAAGTAAGFAAAYNTPLAGVFFVLEIVTGLVAFRVVAPVVLATVLATVITRVAVGGGPLYGLRSFSLDSSIELVGYGALGALAGLVGVGFMGLLRAGEAAFLRLPLPRAARGALGGLGVGLLAVSLPEVTGNGYEVIQRMLDGRFGVAMLAVLLLTKSIATVSSVSSGSPGGVFTPSMFLGAALGGLLGQAADAVGGPHASGGFVLVGMAALIAATTHAPVMATVLGFELSGDYGVVLPLFIATTIATAIARRVTRDSIYTAELTRRGIPWEGTLAQRLARSVRARDIFEKDPLTIDGRAPAIEAAAMLRASRARAVYVMGGESIKVIDLRIAARLAFQDSTITAADAAVPVPAASPDATLLDLSEKLWNVDWGEMPVVEPRDPSRLLGVVSRRAILGALDRELLQRDLLYTRVVTFEGSQESADYLELPQGYRVEVIAPPPGLVGRAADLCRIRADAGVNIIGVRRAEAPTPDGRSPWSEPDGLILQAHDRLLVLGRSEAIERLRGQKDERP